MTTAQPVPAITKRAMRPRLNDVIVKAAITIAVIASAKPEITAHLRPIRRVYQMDGTKAMSEEMARVAVQMPQRLFSVSPRTSTAKSEPKF